MGRKRRGRKEGSIYKRKDGRWVGVANAGYRNGKRHRVSVYGTSYEDAADKLFELRQRLAKGLAAADGNVLLQDFLDEWLTVVVKPNVRPRTYESYSSTCRIHISPALGHRKLDALRAHHVQAMLAEKQAEGLSARTVEMSWQVLRRALKVAIDWDLVVRNVADQVKPPRPQRKEVKPLSKEQIENLLDQAASTRFGAAFVLALTTGMRRGEILGLRWSAVDLESEPATLRVREQLQRVEGELRFSDPKSDRGSRTLALSLRSERALRRHRKQQLEERLEAGEIWEDQDLVFATSLGGPVDPRNFLRGWHMFLDDAGIDRMRFHDARHSAASFMLSQGLPLKLVSETLGHSSILMTADLYGHLMPGDHHRVAEVMNQAFGSE